MCHGISLNKNSLQQNAADLKSSDSSAQDFAELERSTCLASQQTAQLQPHEAPKIGQMPKSPSFKAPAPGCSAKMPGQLRLP